MFINLDKTIKNTMNYIHTFKNLSEQTEYYNSTAYTEPCVSSVMGEEVKFNKGVNANGHEYVDLGLPSRTLWATMNVGATASTDAGLYFAWGENIGYAADQVGEGPGMKNFDSYVYDEFMGTGYKYGMYNAGEEPDHGMTKYNITDGKSVLDAEDDAASVYLGGDWHLPRIGQISELIANTTNSWVTDYNGSGVNGTLYTSNTNGNTLFVPAFGHAYEGSVRGIGVNGSLWSNTVSDTNGVENAKNLLGDSNGSTDRGTNFRFAGLQARGVIG